MTVSIPILGYVIHVTLGKIDTHVTKHWESVILLDANFLKLRKDIPLS